MNLVLLFTVLFWLESGDDKMTFLMPLFVTMLIIASFFRLYFFNFVNFLTF